MTRHHFAPRLLLLSAIGWVVGTAAHAGPVNVVEMPLAQVAAGLDAGTLSSVDVTTAYIARIRAKDGPLKAVILIAPDALQQAAASDDRRKQGRRLSALDGVPILLKDNIEVRGMPTTAGSFALAQNIPVEDSEIARRLRAAGVVLLGKTNLDQWAGMRTNDAFNGSTVGGGPHNPYDLSRTACGSSSGPGIAAAMSFAAAAIGSETNGSVICPAAFMGLVGMKPSIALISRRGVVPISLNQDTVGPLARSVTDAAMLLTVMAGSDAGDPASKDADAHAVNFAKALDADSLKGAKLGVLRDMSGYDKDTAVVFNRALDVLKAQGAQLVEIPINLFEDLSQEQRIVLLYDFKEDINTYLAHTPPGVKTRTLADLIAFNQTDPREKLHTQDIFEAANATVGGRQNPEYIRTLAYLQKRVRAEGIDRAVREFGVKALVVLSYAAAGPIPVDGTPQPTYQLAVFPKGTLPPDAALYASVAGYPNLTVPMGLSKGLPLGLSFIGPRWSDQMLLSLGYSYEQASHARVPPK